MEPYLPGTASLIEVLDKKLMVLLRDGRTLIGYLRSIDQFANLVLHRTIERIHVDKKFGDIDIGVIIIRGENVVLCGEIDAEREANSKLERVSVDEIFELQRNELVNKMEKEKLKMKEGFSLGNCLDFLDDY
ncbi:U6 snRNA-associated Sm-like protein LSm1 [Tetranychus urticae]|uniref:U6 snRNA-associated Sm-like protein LSm1 n=1 Tax=Tetranychus urticae TaxID=32264 RepID=UPI00077B9BEC|nr:U6 snRNA-associated Sm-like protein LSm1 [Tetranychus urticae]